MRGLETRRRLRRLLMGLALVCSGCGSENEVVAACEAAAERLKSCDLRLPPELEAAVGPRRVGIGAGCDVEAGVSRCAPQRAAFYRCLELSGCSAVSGNSCGLALAGIRRCEARDPNDSE